jgi:uncharacterized protein
MALFIPSQAGMQNLIILICLPHCAACCIAPSINSPLTGMPRGKPAGVRCVQLTDYDRCAIFRRPERPAF